MHHTNHYDATLDDVQKSIYTRYIYKINYSLSYLNSRTFLDVCRYLCKISIL